MLDYWLKIVYFQVKWSNNQTQHSTTPFVDDMYDQLKETLSEYEVITCRWPEYTFVLEKVCHKCALHSPIFNLVCFGWRRLQPEQRSSFGYNFKQGPIHIFWSSTYPRAFRCARVFWDWSGPMSFSFFLFLFLKLFSLREKCIQMKFKTEYDFNSRAWVLTYLVDSQFNSLFYPSKDFPSFVVTILPGTQF